MLTSSSHLRLLNGVLLGALVTGCPALIAQTAPEGAGVSREEQERFLLGAEILDVRGIGTGVTGSQVATLSNGRMRHKAQIQNVDIFMEKFTAGKASEMNFRDYWGFNVAAYRLDKLLDLQMVPVSVERSVEGKRSSVTWWIDGAAMTAREYLEGDWKAPDPTRLNDQKRLAWAFQQLIQNRDPNLGNFVFDESWKVWMIDFTRGFRVWKKLEDVKPLTRVPRRFYDGLRALDLEAVERELEPYLKKAELKGLFARRRLLVEHYDRLIKERGESVVLIDRPGN